MDDCQALFCRLKKERIMAKQKAKYVIKSAQAPMDGLLVIRPAELGGSRDYLMAADSDESVAEFAQMGIEERFVERFEERYARGVIRGLHFHRANPYGKLIAVTAGRILSVAVDMRPESKSFGAAYSVELSAENEAMFYVPAYYAHGFMTLEAGTEVLCNFGGEHDEAEESVIIYNDEILAIDWQFERYEIDEKYLNMTQRDKRAKSFRMYNVHDLWPNRPKRSKYAIRV